MSAIVIDSSVAIKWFLPEPFSTEARRLLDSYRTNTLSFVAPDLLNAEFGNILWKKQIFHGLAAADAQNVIAEFRKLEFTFISSASLLDEAYRLAVAYQRTVYDSIYLALSIRENCQLVTADERFVNAIGSAIPNLVWLPNWH